MGLEWIAFTVGEHIPGGGNDDYVRHCRDQLEQIMAAINLDGVGGCPGPGSITTRAGSQPCPDGITELTSQHPGVVWVEKWPRSHSSSFSLAGRATCSAFSAVGGGGCEHLPGESMKRVDAEKLSNISR